MSLKSYKNKLKERIKKLNFFIKDFVFKKIQFENFSNVKLTIFRLNMNELGIGSKRCENE